MRMLSHVIQEAIERDSANRSRTENILSKEKKNEIPYICQHYTSEMRDDVEMGGTSYKMKCELKNRTRKKEISHR
jgi:hypothetical protein